MLLILIQRLEVLVSTINVNCSTTDNTSTPEHSNGFSIQDKRGLQFVTAEKFNAERQFQYPRQTWIVVAESAQKQFLGASYFTTICCTCQAFFPKDFCSDMILCRFIAFSSDFLVRTSLSRKIFFFIYISECPLKCILLPFLATFGFNCLVSRKF